MHVDPERVARFLERIPDRHGDIVAVVRPERPTVLEVTAADGTHFALASVWGMEHTLPTTALDPDALNTWATPPARLGLVLLRRGGYAIGTSDGARLSSHSTGSRYVQSRTAKGGWSQQRFARRRANQADELVGAAADKARTMLLDDADRATGLDGLVLGGDKALLADLVAQPRLAALADLPRREFHDIPDPKFAVLQDTLRRARTITVSIIDPTGGQ